jgi:hypothetical protein
MINEAKLNELIGRVLGDLGGAMSIAVVRMGDSLGLYKTLHAKGPLTPASLAAATATSERYGREWVWALPMRLRPWWKARPRCRQRSRRAAACNGATRRRCFCATASFFRPGYRANLVDKWLPTLDGVVDKLKAAEERWPMSDAVTGYRRS